MALPRCSASGSRQLGSTLLARLTLALGRGTCARSTSASSIRWSEEPLVERSAEGDTADELIRGHGLAGRALFRFADRMQRLEALLLSGDGSMKTTVERAAHYADAVESLLEQPRYLMLMGW